MNLQETLQDIYQRLMVTPEEVGMSVDEIYAYVKKFNLNRDSLYSFIKARLAKPMSKENKKQPTYEEYLEILKAKRAFQGTNYADSMVFYKGKVLGRCPAGTTRAGKTCVPGAPAMPKGPGYEQTDLGGLSRAQVQALSKARSTEDIIKAHKKSNKND
jgi:hypothetical protein